jgi:hypothetical protein
MTNQVQPATQRNGDELPQSRCGFRPNFDLAVVPAVLAADQGGGLEPLRDAPPEPKSLLNYRQRGWRILLLSGPPLAVRQVVSTRRERISQSECRLVEMASREAGSRSDEATPTARVGHGDMSPTSHAGPCRDLRVICQG